MTAPAITVPGTVSRHWKTGHVSALPARPGSPRREDDSEEVTAQQVDDRIQVLAIDVEHGPLCGAGGRENDRREVTADIAAAYDRVLVTATRPASIAYITEE